jgi:hypothetical protein
LDEAHGRERHHHRAGDNQHGPNGTAEIKARQRDCLAGGGGTSGNPQEQVELATKKPNAITAIAVRSHARNVRSFAA